MRSTSGDHGVDSRPARLPRPRAGAGVRRRRDRATRSVPARRHGRRGRPDPRRDRRRRADLRPRRLRRGRDLRHGARRARRCATLGADVEWHLPSRFEEGYGVSGRSRSRRLADEGCSLLLTVDCGITAVEEVGGCEGARPRGDRHRPPPARRRRCRTARSWRRARRTTRSRSSAAPASSRKLAQALGVDVAPHLDLVALATIADVVPLLDENRSLADRGPRALARTQRPGLHGADANARVDPAAVDAGRGRLPARAADQRRRPALAARTPRSSSC